LSGLIYLNFSTNLKGIHFTYFDIDLADIWEYECNCYEHKEKSFEYYQELYIDLQPLYINAGHQPYLSAETIEKGKNKQDYYDRTNEMLQRSRSLFKIFYCQESFFDMKQPCIISIGDVNKSVFQKLFSLKLAQYKHGIINIKDFLIYHLSKSFNNDQKEFYDFLHVTLIEGSELLGKTVIDQVNRIISSSDPLPKLTKPENLPYYRKSMKEMKAWLEKPDDIQEGTDESPEEVNESPKNEMPLIPHFEQETPSDYQIIKGKFTKEEIFHFFSFLFKEKSENDKPFLPEKEVVEILKYGIAIPPPNLIITRCKLNCSNRFPKKIITYAIYKFYTLYTNSNKSKLDILRFFASYLDDFHSALDSKENLENLSKNIRIDKPSRMNFEIENYFPLST